MKEYKKNRADTREDGQKNPTRAVFVFSYSNYSSDKSNNLRREYHADSHIPPTIVKIKNS